MPDERPILEYARPQRGLAAASILGRVVGVVLSLSVLLVGIVAILFSASATVRLCFAAASNQAPRDVARVILGVVVGTAYGAAMIGLSLRNIRENLRRPR